MKLLAIFSLKPLAFVTCKLNIKYICSRNFTRFGHKFDMNKRNYSYGFHRSNIVTFFTSLILSNYRPLKITWVCTSEGMPRFCNESDIYWYRISLYSTTLLCHPCFLDLNTMRNYGQRTYTFFYVLYRFSLMQKI